ncbi:MAG: membrane protein insertion efficiency factor YidD [Clostridia bacterium]|nr:membrane protein insertion efficiency factor YidD [Clostridia bacterium]
MGVITYICARRILVGIVFLYKIFAPEWLRGQCRFEPTCSTYMILAIRKYGIIIGVSKGFHRIIRCRPPNGGVDYP